MKHESKQAAAAFLSSVREELPAFVEKLDGETYEQAADLILASRAGGGRLHVTGIGKPGHVAAYMASLFSSTGTPCYFLHGTEAVHGSCGQLAAGDVVISISNSGETAELKSTVLAIKNNGCKVIGVSGNPESWLAGQSDAFLYAGVGAEGGPMNRAPRNSILAELVTLQALSAALQAEQNWSVQEYVRCHPGGKLGQLRDGEK
ncbi:MULTISPECIES: KpsF/GutQ family sugar-phosphate isomerase [unclassified Oscillibacter]|uniref:KpsF/GutQ family sugar-phosphate isomerase n=1 Tax=unclassified Oscillibacter TaxID=2629304 RepID=UPI0025E7627A|nr:MULTISPECIES: SIS domain-containing protein [unclassified Oscillibacter]